MTVRSIITTFTMITALGSSTASAKPPAHDHLGQAHWYVDHIDPAQPGLNTYGGSHSAGTIWLRANEDEVTESQTRCGSFVALLLKQSYEELLSVTNRAGGNDVLFRMIGSTSPNSEQWYSAIKEEKSYDKPGDGSDMHFEMNRIRFNRSQPGDVMASKYAGSNSSGDTTGHNMVLAARRAPTAAEMGPVLPNTIQHVVTVIDSSSSVHSNDTRTTNGNLGLGQGDLLVYEDASTGEVAAWTWSIGPNATAFGPTQRPMQIGRLSGPAVGLPATP